MTDPRLELFLRSGAGISVFAGLGWWLWSASGARATELFRTRTGDVPAMARVTWACAILTLSAMLLGTLGQLHPLTWASLIAVGGLLLRGGRAKPGLAGVPDAAGPWFAAPSWLFVLGVATVVLGRLIYGLRNPPTDVDSIVYHMPMVAHWMATGGLGAAQLEPQQIASFYPGNVEILALGFAWMAGRETLMTVPGVLSLGLLAFALRRLALEAGARTTVAEVLALALACAPGVVQLTIGLRVENVMAAWFAVALLFALRARRTGARGDLEVTLCAIGLLAGCKATGPALAFFVIAMLVTGPRPRVRPAAILSSRLGLATLVIAGGFWLVRNAIASGNPVFPATIQLGPWLLPGLASQADLAVTSQFAIWRSGLPGHLTPQNLFAYVGPIGLLLVPGALAGFLVLVTPRRQRDRPVAVAMLAAATLATALLTIFQPFSGALGPLYRGGPMGYSADNVRFAMPTLVALVPLAAVGLSELPVVLVVLISAALALPGLVPRAGHVVPALLFASLLGLCWAVRPRGATFAPAWRVALLLVPCVILAAAVTMVEPMRDRMSDAAWDRIIRRFDSVPASVAREVRAEAAGRPIAVAGAISVWAFYGRELRGRPEYVPVGYPLAEARSRWRFAPDLRERADATLWRRNLRESGAPFVVLVSGEQMRPIERSWCERDPGHFQPVYVTGRRAVYRVNADPREALVASRPVPVAGE